MRKFNFLLVIALVAMLSGTVLAQGVPVDIPGTGVNFFLYRYEGNAVPYDKISTIWENITKAFQVWVDAGQEQDGLSGADVRVQGNDIYVKDQFILTVDQYHANANKATRAQLAEKWAANLRKGVDVFVATNTGF
ncbi:MAG: hypothetical protein GX979_10960 [Firmicutes bacterium]|nr:hypothetical protein [Bacillota bacterium]